MVGGGPFNLKPGEWTDDTSMALCLADSLLEQRGFVARDFAQQMLRWYRQGHNSMNGRCFDIGRTTSEALEGWETSSQDWYADFDPMSAGNGSVIRLAPIAIAYRSTLPLIWELTGSSSKVTHGAVEAVFGCKFLGLLLCHALQGASREQVLHAHVAQLPPRLQMINAGEYKMKDREDIRSSGYVVDTLEAALWSIWNTTSFKQAVLLAANLADDADSVAAVCGQLAGAIYGMSGMPGEWVALIAWSEQIKTRADLLFDMNKERSG